MDREKTNSEHQWDLTKLFSTDEDWEIEYQKLMKDLEDFSGYKGKISSSGEMLLRIITEQMELHMRLDHIHMYSVLKHFQDTRNNKYANLYSKAELISVKSQNIDSFVKPEILAMGEEKVNSFISSTKGLELYKHDFDNIFRRAKHTLSEKEEKSLAEVKAISNLPVNLYNLLNNNQIKFENAVDKTGNKIEITPGKFKNLMSSPDRVIRESTYNSVFGAYTEMKEIFAGVYAGNIKNEAYFAKARGYNSSLEASLFENNIPVEVYQNLITTVGNGLEAFQKYFGLVKNVLGLEILKPYDINAPIFAESKK